MKKGIVIFIFVCCGNFLFSLSAKTTIQGIDEEKQIVIEKNIMVTVFAKESLSENGTTFSIANLFDHNLQTCWATRFTGKQYEDGAIRIVFKMPIYVIKLAIYNGFQKSQSLYLDNHRVKNINIEKIIVGKRSYPLENSFTLKDSEEKQEFSTEKGWRNEINIFKTQELIINFTDIYKGRKYDDLCISEITIDTNDKTSYMPSMTWDQLFTTIKANRKIDGENWLWNDLMNPKHNYFADLLYYIVNGNKEAKRLFDKFKTQSTSEGESLDFIFRPAIKATLGSAN